MLYQIPIGDWQRAIVLGFAPYLLVFVTLHEPAGAAGLAGARRESALLDSLAYLALVLFWTHAAWRQDEPARASCCAVRSVA